MADAATAQAPAAKPPVEQMADGIRAASSLAILKAWCNPARRFSEAEVERLSAVIAQREWELTFGRDSFAH